MVRISGPLVSSRIAAFTSFAHHVAQVLDTLTVFCIIIHEVQTHHVHARVSILLALSPFGFGFRTDKVQTIFVFFATVLVFKLRRIWKSGFGRARPEAKRLCC